MGLLTALLLRFDPLGGSAAVIGAGVITVCLLGRGRRPTAVELVVALGLCALLAVAGVRAAPWAVAACVLGAMTAGVVLLLGARTWTGLVLTPIAAVCGLAPAAGWTGRTMGGRSRSALTRAKLGAAVAVGTLALLIAFGALFAGADPAFAALLDRLSPDLDPLQLAGRVQIGAMVAVIATVLAYLAASPPAVDAFTVAAGRRWPRAVWAVPVAALDLLFATFVLVQLAVLFGGHRRILTGQGLTYAQYAREGFGQLLAVTVLTLVVVAVTVRIAPLATRFDRALIRGLLGMLCLLALVVVASAVHRMSLYEQAYGFTRLRLAGTAIELFLGAVLILVLIVGVRQVPLVPAVVVVGMAGLLGLAALNPDAYIAERNIDRYERTGKIDLDYLSRLSADAVPALVRRLPAGLRDCALAPHAALRTGSADPWFDPNRARDRARTLLADPSIGPCASPTASAAPAAIRLPKVEAIGKDLADVTAKKRGR